MGDLINPDQPKWRTPDGNGGGGSENRLRNVEERLTRIEEQMKNVATKTWILGSVLAIIFTVVLALPASLYFILQLLLLHQK